MPDLTLTAEEARVLGALMEKSVTTPDAYPLSLNSVVTACNQTTNRDPVVKYSDDTVEHALDALREKALVRRLKSAGQRVIKYRHVADETLSLDPGEFAVAGVLLLRGAQTPGELKGRTERWHGFASLDEVERVLEKLSGREMVAQLARRAGQKEARWMQLFSAGDAITAEAPAEATTVDVVAPPPPAVARTLDIRNPATGAVL